MPHQQTTPYPAIDKQHRAVLRMLGRAFARLSHLFGYSAHAVSTAFKEGYMEYMLEKSPRAKVVEIAIRSGIDRRHVSEYLRHRHIKSWHKPTRFDLILSELKWLTERSDDGRIPVHGATHSLEAICKRHASGNYTTAAVLDELIRKDNVEYYTENDQIRLKNWLSISSNDEFSKAAIWSVELLTQTLEKNKNTPDPAQRNFQRFLYSSQIPQYRVEELHGEIMEKLNGYYQELTGLLEKAESNVRPGTFPLYGVSFYEFGREPLPGQPPIDKKNPPLDND